MNKARQEKIRRFVDDVVMNEAVYEVLLHSFLKEQPDKNVQTLAASRIAIDLLNDGFKELNRYKVIEEPDNKSTEITYV